MEYLEVERARALSGLRLVLTRDVPGPWGEAAKAFFAVKKVPFVVAEQVGGAANEALRDWTGQTSAPVAAWNDEPPVWAMNDILFLAERLGPEPSLIPADPAERALMFGLAHEISGREGLGWSRRICMFGHNYGGGPAPEGTAGVLARRYGWSPGLGAAAARRVVEILGVLRDQLAAQRARGRAYLVGAQLSAVDLLWAAFSNMVVPLSHAQCPMPEYMRELYGLVTPGLEDGLADELLELRDRIFREHLTLPMDF